MKIRKTVFMIEEIAAEGHRDLAQSLRRVAVLAVIDNPYAGQTVEDLSPLFDIGMELGDRLMPRLALMLERPAVAYGKAAIVGILGDPEHGAALIHPKLGKPMRAAIGGGDAIIPSTCKVATAGTSIDLPLGHKDNVWSFDHLDTMTVGLADAPRPDEVLVAMALAEGGRPWARVGKGRSAT